MFAIAEQKHMQFHKRVSYSLSFFLVPVQWKRRRAERNAMQNVENKTDVITGTVQM